MDKGDAQSVEVIPDDVIHLGQTIAGIHRLLRQALDVTARDVDSLTRGEWTGDAGRAFAHGWSESNKAGTDILRTLETLARKLHVAGDEYGDADTASAETIDKALNV